MDGLRPDSLPSRIASLVHTHFDGLPARCKPVVRDDGTEEWIPMTGIVVVKGENTPSETLTCVAVTTGAKCLSSSQVPMCKGLVLHDSHAEILAIRAFNFWLLSECHSIIAHERHSSTPSSMTSPYIRRHRRHRRPSTSDNQVSHSDSPSPSPGLKRTLPPFEIQSDINIYMYCTCAPCGDASMELCIAAQDDPTPWTIPQSRSAPNPNQPLAHNSNNDDNPRSDPSTIATDLAGRADFSRLGIVRRKPARADAESTKSKSCSDKLALRQVSSLLSHITSLLVVPTKHAYLAGVILPEEEITRVGCERSFGENGRMKALKGQIWPSPSPSSSATSPEATASTEAIQFAFHPFQVLSIPTNQLEALWPFRKPKQDHDRPKRTKPGTKSAVWVRAPTIEPPCSCSSLLPSWDTGSKSLPTLRGSKTGLFETIINGVKQGHRASSPGVRGASALSRAKMWGFLNDIGGSMQSECGCNLGDSLGESGDPTPSQDPELDYPLTLLVDIAKTNTYDGFKKPSSSSIGVVQERKYAIQDAKNVLGGWVPNQGDEDWGLEVLIDSKKRKR